MKHGIFCISIDHELLWGRQDLNYAPYINRVEKERDVINKILFLFQKYKIPATWAIVGKTMKEGDPLWYGKDIVDNIKRIKNQELASHSYSHKIFTNISESEALTEITKNKIGTTFVFPRNKIAYLNLLKREGYTAFRGEDVHKMELILPSSPPVYSATNESGLVNIPGSMYFVSSRGLRILIPFGLRFLKVYLGIKKAIKERKIFHLWFHPIDFVDNSKYLFKEFEIILSLVNKMRNKGELEILTMNQIENRYK